MAQRRNTRPQIYHKYGQVCLQAFKGWEFTQNIILTELTNSVSVVNSLKSFTLTCLCWESSLIVYYIAFQYIRINYSQGMKLEPLHFYMETKKNCLEAYTVQTITSSFLLLLALAQLILCLISGYKAVIARAPKSRQATADHTNSVCTQECCLQHWDLPDYQQSS